MSTDRFLHFDAAYVFGALDADDRVAFEGHLLDCADCRARVAEARATTALLAGLGAGADLAADEVEAPPDTLLPGLLRRASSERRRRWTLTAALGAVAAACVVALAIALWPASTPDRPPSRPFVAVQSAPVEASAFLVSREWGTEINVQCRYTRELEQGTAYRLVVVDTSQQRYDAGGWTLGKDTAEFTGGTQVRRGDIATVEITLSDGQPILQLTP